MSKHHWFLTTALCAVLAALPLAQASAEIVGDFTGKKAGTFMVRGRALGVIPNPGDEHVMTAAGVDTGLRMNSITTTVIPEVDFSYFITDNIAAELILATTRHHLSADKTDVGDVQLLPPTLTAQYHFMPDQRFSPYVGAGVNYTIFFAEKSAQSALVDHLEVENAFGAALQFGVDYAVSGNWGLNLDVKRLWLRTDATTASLKVDDVNIDPWLVGLGVSYKF